MKLFESARFRLTAWYLIIVAIISITFSAVIYRDVTLQLQRGFEAAQQRILTQFPLVPRKTVQTLLADDLSRATHQVLTRLVLINAIILSAAGVAAYFLARKTLSPIEASVEEQKRFISDASHELRTPLTVIRSEIEVALRDKAISRVENRRILKSNLEEVEKMQNLTNYLLTLSRLESGKAKLVKEKINIAEIAQKVVDKYDKDAGKKKLTLVTKFKDTVIRANATSIEQLFTILIDNAIKYSLEGKEITISIREAKRQVVIEVTDLGIGIKASELPYIFNRFYRADTSRCKSEVNGYGLGLAIAKSIVEAHSGEINVESTVGKGSTFRAVLPSY